MPPALYPKRPTPPPWKLTKNKQQLIGVGEIKTVIAQIYERADGPMLEAAPDMYAALKLLEPYAREVINVADGIITGKRLPSTTVIEQARATVAAIEKAERKIT